ncbi:hypothetical protein NW762_005174 [Fusarium torreyae]|uniref:Uncharacterized protein n=1 Tax=Fusarium torreyae TaxID=1237075 RepID=A0A9W8S5F5_9HYPO|nr:hypothetical protein NW762_005174 [Fusarium torreyae]
MASAGASEFKSPKIPRRPKTPESRQVHFEPQAKSSSSSFNNNERITGFTTANSPRGGFSTNINGVSAPKTPPGIKITTTTAATATTSAPVDTQPTNFPALGLGPNNHLQWHTSANPTQSLSHQVPTSFVSPTPQQQQIFSHPQFHPASFINTGPNNIAPSPITYIGIGPQPPAANHANMGDYQNAAPPTQGVHFQPPVPDTTFGPMQHVYVPRFDGGLAGVQVGHPTSLHYVSATPFASPPAPLTTAACTTVVLPKTFYLNGYTYYASLLCCFVFMFRLAMWGSSESSGSVFLCGIVERLQPVVGAMAPQPSVHGSYVVQQQPYYVQQPAMGQQPVFVAGQQQQYIMPQIQQVAGVPGVGLAGGAAVPGAVPVFAGNAPVPAGHHIPEVSGIGRTAGEEQLRQVQFAHANKMYEPQDFKPADDDPSRFYYVREVDGNWTQRNRFTIDHMGDSRWYVTDEGWFYAVRLPN